MNNNKGFSLVELLIAIALIAIVSAIGVPQLVQQLPKFHAKGTARDIAGKFMMARLRAIQENKQYAVLFTLGSVDTYKVQRSDDNGVSWNDAGAAGEGSSDINVALESCVVSRVIFRADGSAETTGGITTTCTLVGGSRKILTVSTVAGQTFNLIVYVSSFTGNIKVE